MKTPSAIFESVDASTAKLHGVALALWPCLAGPAARGIHLRAAVGEAFTPELLSGASDRSLVRPDCPRTSSRRYAISPQ
jgi:hypothetical protein